MSRTGIVRRIAEVCRSHVLRKNKTRAETRGGPLGDARLHSLRLEVLEDRAMLSGQGFDFPGVVYGLWGNPESAVAADLNGDGAVDYVIATSSHDHPPLRWVFVLQNQGDGTFAAPVAYGIGTSHYESFTLADADADGAVDLIAINEDGVVVLPNQGDGTFADPVTYEVEGDPRSVTTADADGDGAVDLIVLNAGGVVVLRNQGDGIFAAPVTYEVGYKVGYNDPSSVFPVDVDGDGAIDLITAHSGSYPDYFGSVSVLRNQGDGTFAEHGSYAMAGTITIADINGDGAVDVVGIANGSVSILRNQGDGTFADQVLYDVLDGVTFVTPADIDGDGAIDLITANWDPSVRIAWVSVLRNQGDGVFPTRSTYQPGADPDCVAAADVNGDGAVDLVTANRDDRTVSVFRNLGDGTFAARVKYAVGGYPASLVCADVDGDGAIDLVTANWESDSISILRNLGDGTFAPRVSYMVDGGPISVAAADIDGDGAIDLVTANEAIDAVSVLRNLGDGTFAIQGTHLVDYRPRSVAAADVDGDGAVDLITANVDSNTVSVLRNLEDGSFAAQVPYQVGDNPSSLVPADLDGDGAVDLITGHAGSDTVSVLMNLGGGTFADQQVVYPEGWSPFTAANFVTAADVNGDGAIDLITAFLRTDDSPGPIQVSRNLGDGTFAPPVVYLTNRDLRSVAVADVNGDGAMDLIAVNVPSYTGIPLYPSTISVLPNLIVPTNPDGDLNADGLVGSADLDIVRANWGQSVEPGDLLAGDPSGDGTVGSADLDIVRANWGAGVSAAASEVAISPTNATSIGPRRESATDEVLSSRTKLNDHRTLSDSDLATLAEAAWLREIEGLRKRRERKDVDSRVLSERCFLFGR